MRRIFSIVACLGMAACSDPIADFPRLADQDIPANAQFAAAGGGTSAQDSAFFTRLMAGGETTPSSEADPAAETGVPSEANVEAEAAPVLAALESTRDGGAARTETAPRAQRAGLFGLGIKSSPPATSEIAPGTVLPYGKVARICDLPESALGKKIAAFPERAPKHAIYDSAPGTLEPHSFYLTGFADGCARQFTASLAMFGTVGMHEQLRYGLPAEVQPYSDTDKAYEAVKSRVCGVPSQKPCGAKISRLDDTTVFVSIYERFGTNPTWSNLLLHEGEIVAQDQKGG